MTHLIERLESTERDWCQIHELPLNAESRGLIVRKQEEVVRREGSKTDAIQKAFIKKFKISLAFKFRNIFNFPVFFSYIMHSKHAANSYTNIAVKGNITIKDKVYLHAHDGCKERSVSGPETN